MTTHFDNGTITVTDTEVRTKTHTFYLDHVISVDVASFTLGRMLLVPLLVCVIPAGFLALMLARMFGWYLLKPMFAGFTPLVLLGVALCYLRNTRVVLGTTGGPVIIAQKLGFGDHSVALSEFNRLKRAIENSRQANRK